jgi:UDP-N-acetylmuramoylalanine--D-glutamate ligase
MGLGRFGGGVDAAKFAAGAGAKVTITDLAAAEQLSDSISKLEEFPAIEFHFGSHDPADFQEADIIIANPAVAPGNAYLQLARQHGKLVTSQIGIFFQLCPARIIGITGANGKSTTAALTAHLLKNTSDESVWLSGNIGNEPLLTIIEQIKPSDLVVLELSSFQLEQLAEIEQAPDVALLTNLTPNHLDRYGTFAEYCDAKENIFTFQDQGTEHPAVSIFNAEDDIAARWYEKYRKDPARICLAFSSADVSEQMHGSFTLPGRANLSNLAAAVAVARYFGADEQQMTHALANFKPLPDRLEPVAQVNGVRWYNDSKATTPQGATVALNAFDQPRIIIAGGYDKNLAFDELGQEIAESAKAAILIGQTADKIAGAVHRASDGNRKPHVRIVHSLAEAVQAASRLAVDGDVVLLSPACASYDMFENYEQRGQEFVKLVKALNMEMQESNI